MESKNQNLLENNLNLNTINNQSSTASEDLQIDYKGDDIEIGFNSRYIMDLVNNLEDEEKIRWPTIFQYVLGGLLHTHNYNPKI